MKLEHRLQKGIEYVKKLGLKEWGVVLLVGLCFLVIVLPAGKKEPFLIRLTKECQFFMFFALTRDLAILTTIRCSKMSSVHRRFSRCFYRHP